MDPDVCNEDGLTALHQVGLFFFISLSIPGCTAQLPLYDDVS